MLKQGMCSLGPCAWKKHFWVQNKEKTIAQIHTCQNPGGQICVPQQHAENTGLLNAFVADVSCFLRMFYAIVSQRFQKRASGSAVEPAWLGDRSPPCSVAGRGGKNVSVRSWEFTARERRESLLRGARSTCLGLPESFVFLSALQGSPEMADTEARTSLQGCCGQQEGCLLKPFFPLFCHLATFCFSTEEVNCSGRYLDIM